ncbi:hypothetical protein PVK06_013020 [Gossypium arboreum]|uniref:RNase H type-1 domain-containing protein n=1 Tax=Gossypium arboreum TaxID=29729 RepID=A0ABR0QD34_GOSAR|nr:hypothetical protein PVK06_013020 [Gossypium arboreum]
MMLNDKLFFPYYAGGCGYKCYMGEGLHRIEHQYNAFYSNSNRGSNANWLCGFFTRVGKDSIFRVEAIAILEELSIAWERNFRQIDVECDNALLVETILSGGVASTKMMQLCLIHQLLTQNKSNFIIFQDLKTKLPTKWQNMLLMVYHDYSIWKSPKFAT